MNIYSYLPAKFSLIFFIKGITPAGRRGIICHAGLDPASNTDFWIPAFAGMTLSQNAAGN